MPPSTRTKRARHQEHIEKAELRAARNLPKYIATLERLALGIWVEETDPESGERLYIYQQKPDRAALALLIDRGMGKVPGRLEITGDGGGPVNILPWLPSTANKELSEGVIEGEAREVDDS